MVEVFKTNVREHAQLKLLAILSARFPHYKINFDLEDCDRILRVEGENISTEEIIQLLTANDCHCSILE